MKKLCILGSTGSIGTQTLDIVKNNTDLQVIALTAHRNVELMERQVREYRPKLAVMTDEEAYRDLKMRLQDEPVTVEYGMEGMLHAATLDEVDVVVTAVVGMIGIRPTMAAIEAHKTIALANKETLVTAGHLIIPLASQNEVSILPVDSEHSAIFQCLHKENRERLTKILLTASGGPFRGYTAEQLRTVDLKKALRHPNWSMGRKITVDSASLVNKGLEVMEAKWLFGVDLDQIQVVIHPQSILHSAVEFADGGIIGQMGAPDMRLPIQYALFYPDRRPMEGKRVNLFELGEMTFEKPDPETFLGLKYAYEAARAGGVMPTVFNAANEKAVSLFLEEKIHFLHIYDLIQACMEDIPNICHPNLDCILETEAAVYEHIDSLLDGLKKIALYS